MSAAIKTAVDSWAFPVPVTLSLLLMACVYTARLASSSQSLPAHDFGWRSLPLS